MPNRSKPGARPATGRSATPGSSPGKPPNLTNKRKWPKYTPDQQAVLSTFLGAWLAVATNAVVESRKVARGTPPNHPARATVAYWEHVCSGIAWLADKVPVRQQHLYVAELVETGQLPEPGGA